MNVCDRELLELAAKGAGINVVWSELAECFFLGEECLQPWNPLDDDGHALRLAVDMKIDIFPWINSAQGGATQARNHHGTRTQERSADNSGCIYSATRRAIVRAAAEIGRCVNG